MRLLQTLPIMLFLAACGAPEPQPTASGPRLEGSIAATWPAAAPARQAIFSDDGRLLATSDASGLITIRETGGWKVLQQFHHPVGATSLAFSPDGGHLYSGGYDGTVRDWDLKRRALAQTFNGPRGTVWTVDISPDGKRLAAAGEDAVIRIWPLYRTGAPMLLRGHTLNIWDVRFSPDGKRLASGSFDHLVKLWDVGSGKLLQTLAGHREAVVGLDYSPDGKMIATGRRFECALLAARRCGPSRTAAMSTRSPSVPMDAGSRRAATRGRRSARSGMK